MGKKNKVKTSDNTIALNKRAGHEYHLEEKIEAGIVLQGWEVKSLRLGKTQLTDSYVILKQGEAFLLGAHISPIKTISTHEKIDNTRTRKLLLNQRELKTLAGKINERGYTLIPTKLYWNKNKIKLEIALAKGKKNYDKRQDKKDRDWERQKQQIFKKSLR